MKGYIYIYIEFLMKIHKLMKMDMNSQITFKFIYKKQKNCICFCA